MKSNYIQINGNDVTTYKKHMQTLSNTAFNLLKSAENERKNILTCYQTSDFIESCRKKRHFDAPYYAALRDFRIGGLEVQNSIISVPYDGEHSKEIISEKNYDEHISQKYAEVPILLEDFKIIGRSKHYILECETIKPLPKHVFDFSDRMGTRFADIIILQENIPQLGLPEGAELYTYPTGNSSPELYCIMRGGDDFDTSVFELHTGFSQGMIHYRELIRPEQQMSRDWHDLIMKDSMSKHSAKPI